MSLLHRFRWTPVVLLGMLLATPVSRAVAQNAVITGKVLSETGQALELVNVYITELTISVPTNAQGVYNIVVPAIRVTGQAVTLRVRGVGYLPTQLAIRVTPDAQTHDFSLKKDINRLSEMVVTGSVESTERSKVAFAVGRITAEDIPVPALNPLTALQGKVAGMRIASTSGQPGTQPEIMLRGPTSINSTNRSTGPLMIVDGVILRNQSLSEIGGLDIESVEVVKGAAGAALYGSSAANGVIVIKTRRGAARDGVTWTFRSEYGNQVNNSTDYGQPLFHQLQLDETGTRFCVGGSGNVAPCSKTFNWMQEILRINNVNADTVRTQQTGQWNSPGGSGELLNVFQANPWPGQRYDTFKQLSQSAPVTLNSIEASGRAGGVRYVVNGAYTSDAGSIRGLDGQQQRKARLNLDYDVRPNFSVSISTLYDKGRTDNRGSFFGGILRGAPPGTDYLVRDTLGRGIIKGGGTGFRPTDNGLGTFLYATDNSTNYQNSTRYLANISGVYTPADWATFDASYGYDYRARYNNNYQVKGFRTVKTDAGANNGNQAISNQDHESMNAQVTATFRKQLFTDFNSKLYFRGLIDRDYVLTNNGAGDTYVVKDVYTLSNTTLNKTAGSSGSLIKNIGSIAGLDLDLKGRYILNGSFRYDGSSLFGAGNRWAPFGRVSGVWRISEESFWNNVPAISDFRVRASRGSAGNTPSFAAQYETYVCSATGCSSGQQGNRNLKPETTVETEVGTDFTLLNRLGVEFTYAQSNTKNQILNVPSVASLGFASKWQNAGTLQNKTFEVALNLPIHSGKDFQWNMRGTYDRNRSYITELFLPEYYTNAGTAQGTGSLFLITARTDKADGVPVNRYGNIWGRKFYKNCSDLPASVQSQCGEGKAYQTNDQGWLVWVGEGNSYKDGITKNLWNSKLPAAASPWNYPLQFGHPIVDRPLRGEKDEGVGSLHILGNTLPSFRFGFNNTLTYKKVSLYALLDGTIGHKIQNQGEGWGLLDLSSSYFDQGGKSVETAKPLGYGWRVGGSEGAGSGGFYDLLGPNNYNTENGSYAKFREASLSYQIGKIAGVGDWSLSLIGRNLFTFTKYSGYDPEVGVSGGQAGSGLINQVDAGDFPTLRSYTISISTRFR
ncbi:MAG: SusC/RagA family TonB-linked outer membrane protein [Gemmatimonas sp.]